MDPIENTTPPAPARRGWKLRRVRFGLRSLMVLVLIFSAIFGWIGNLLSGAERQRAAAVAVVSRHGTVDYGKNFRLAILGYKQQLGPQPRHAWLRKQFGDDLFDNVTRVSFFRQEQINDADMALLDAFPELDQFDVCLAPVTDVGIAHLAGMKKLTRVSLSEVPITDVSVLTLARLPLLTDVMLDRTRVGDASLAALGKMPQLRLLDLQWTKITDAGLAHLAGLKRITWLQVDCTEITDAGLEHLRGLQTLKYLSIGATHVTPSGKASIQAALPHCNVTWWARHGDLSDAGGGPKIPEPKYEHRSQ